MIKFLALMLLCCFSLRAMSFEEGLVSRINDVQSDIQELKYDCNPRWDDWWLNYLTGRKDTLCEILIMFKETQKIQERDSCINNKSASKMSGETIDYISRTYYSF